MLGSPLMGGGVALVVLGIILLFIIPWVGIGLGLVGLVVLALALFGVGRRAADADRP